LLITAYSNQPYNEDSTVPPSFFFFNLPF